MISYKQAVADCDEQAEKIRSLGKEINRLVDDFREQVQRGWNPEALRNLLREISQKENERALVQWFRNGMISVLENLDSNGNWKTK